ncbi:hypothetical protein ElyMa_006989500 [Elysia marginata]|uniref:Uncharacterized protein n=1 Tax=Elysia marginata TaxID=1093978 RepID=A0AAV4JRC6_9GAST|nr:hypothetical protein ElyMa_006989500 [Elysia marginata]
MRVIRNNRQPNRRELYAKPNNSDMLRHCDNFHLKHGTLCREKKIDEKWYLNLYHFQLTADKRNEEYTAFGKPDVDSRFGVKYLGLHRSTLSGGKVIMMLQLPGFGWAERENRFFNNK